MSDRRMQKLENYFDQVLGELCPLHRALIVAATMSETYGKRWAISSDGKGTYQVSET
jgi:hypothetical protein